MDFFDRIKELSKLRQIKIEQLVEEINPDCKNPRDTYNGWKRRHTIPRGNVCLSIAKKLGVSVEYLLTGHDPNTDMSTFEKYVEYSELLEIASKLSPEDYRVILSAANKMAANK